MPVRVLIVDDSAFMQRTLRNMLEGDGTFEVVGTAANGQQAVEQVLALKPDVVTMDVEMPVMDGVSAVRGIMARRPTPVLMFSSVTQEGAPATLDALEAGAVDFLPKRFQDIATERHQIQKLLRDKVRQTASARTRLGSRAVPQTARQAPPSRPSPAPAAPQTPLAPRRNRVQPYRLLAIGTSTGGPKALQEVITRLPGNLPVPVLLIQHMPAAFTGTFAQRLDQSSKLSVCEAASGDRLEPGRVYLAPGGRQMLLERQGSEVKIRLQEATPVQIYKPSVDITFTSAAEIYGAGVLAVVLTGMGADGREGARRLSAAGASIWTQDEESCVIYGMPKAIVDAGLSQRVVALAELPERLREEI